MAKKIQFPPPNGMSAEWYRANALTSTIHAASVQAKLLGWPDVGDDLEKVFQKCYDLQTEISRSDSAKRKAKKEFIGHATR
jgi:hypothetical protein